MHAEVRWNPPIEMIYGAYPNRPSGDSVRLGWVLVVLHLGLIHKPMERRNGEVDHNLHANHGGHTSPVPQMVFNQLQQFHFV